MPTRPPAIEGRRITPLTFSHLHGVRVSERLLALSLLGDPEACLEDSDVVCVKGSPYFDCTTLTFVVPVMSGGGPPSTEGVVSSAGSGWGYQSCDDGTVRGQAH